MASRRELILLLLLVVLFAGFFMAAFLNAQRGVAVFGIGFDPVVEDYVIMALSFACLIRTFAAIVSH